ncbi:MAG: hypothetical protein HYV90_00610 [Candidatus Woesebacteria bacterium]|nr:MAG: hypothetical protein HYV90_00610 [Candidatus Woesebacteria bacterium]
MINIIPAILTDNITDLNDKVKRINDASYIEGITVRTIQIDVIDGVFADNRTVDPVNLVGLDTDLGIDFHLMVKEPVNWIEKCANAGADRIIGQIEMMQNQVEFVEKVQETGLYIGLALDLETPVSELNALILNNVDVILLMAVKAGFGGQKFDKHVLDKIKELDAIRVRDRTPFKICVDGGETVDVIDDTHYAGADEVVIGKRLFDGDLAINIKKFTEAADKLE